MSSITGASCCWRAKILDSQMFKNNFSLFQKWNQEQTKHHLHQHRTQYTKLTNAVNFIKQSSQTRRDLYLDLERAMDRPKTPLPSLRLHRYQMTLLGDLCTNWPRAITEIWNCNCSSHDQTHFWYTSSVHHTYITMCQSNSPLNHFTNVTEKSMMTISLL